MDFIFIHINKTGGSSIEQVLGIPFRHRTAREARREIGPAAWASAFKFTVVRNPWDKVVSHYCYRVQTDQTGLADGATGFREWVAEAYGKRNPKYYDKPMMFMPQMDWITDARGRILVDFIARFENLDDDFAKICARLNRPVAALPHLKRSQRGDYRAYYDEPTAAIVARWFRKDIAEFGYTLQK